MDVVKLLRNTAFLAVALGSSCGTLTYQQTLKWEPLVTCTKPIEIDGDLSFPCGKCISCRIQRTNEWSIRLMTEQSSWDHSAFVTLTYSDDKLPKDNRLSKRDLQLFLKRLRKAYPTPIKYYACGEYGDPNKTNRPHYHLIIFGMRISDKHIIEETWNQGLVHVGTVTIDSCRYVASYIQKKLYHQPTERDSDLFQLQSQGLGLKWAEQNKQYLQDNEKITHQGVAMGVPRYYVKKLGLDLSKSQDEKQTKIDEEIKAKVNELNDHEAEIFDLNLRSKVQRDRNITAKTGLKERTL